MVAEHLASNVLAWLGTYLLHSTLLLGGAWTITVLLSRSRRWPDALPAIREGLWRVALLAGLVTASVQQTTGFGPTSAVFAIDTREVASSDGSGACTIDACSTPDDAGDTQASPSHGVPARASVSNSGAALDGSRGEPRTVFVPLLLPNSITYVPVSTEPHAARDAVSGASRAASGRLRARSRTSALVDVAAPPRGATDARLSAGTQLLIDAPDAAKVARDGAASSTTSADGESADGSTSDATAIPTGTIRGAAIEPASPSISWTRALLVLWLCGVSIGCALWAREWITLHRRLRRRVELDRGRAAEIFADVCARSGTRGVRLTSAPGLSGPISIGLWCPEIVVPPRATTQLSNEELEALFAHELAHARRGDPLWLVIYRALEIAFFFQPLNRVARVRLQDEAELLADDWAVTQLATPLSLATCLTEIAGWIVDERRMLVAPAMAARGTRLTLRVRRLLDDDHHPERARRPHGLLLLAGLAVTGVALFGPSVAAERVVVQAPVSSVELAALREAASSATEATDGVGSTRADEPGTAALAVDAPPESTEPAVAPRAIPRASSAAPAASPAETEPYLGELSDMARELDGLRREAARHELSPELHAQLDELASDLERLRVQASALDSLFEASFPTPEPPTRLP